MLLCSAAQQMRAQSREVVAAELAEGLRRAADEGSVGALQRALATHQLQQQGGHGLVLERFVEHALAPRAVDAALDLGEHRLRRVAPQRRRPFAVGEGQRHHVRLSAAVSAFHPDQRQPGGAVTLSQLDGVAAGWST